MRASFAQVWGGLRPRPTRMTNASGAAFGRAHTGRDRPGPGRGATACLRPLRGRREEGAGVFGLGGVVGLHGSRSSDQNVSRLRPHHAETDRFKHLSAVWGTLEGGFR